MQIQKFRYINEKTDLEQAIDLPKKDLYEPLVYVSLSTTDESEVAVGPVLQFENGNLDFDTEFLEKFFDIMVKYKDDVVSKEDLIGILQSSSEDPVLATKKSKMSGSILLGESDNKDKVYKFQDFCKNEGFFDLFKGKSKEEVYWTERLQKEVRKLAPYSEFVEKVPQNGSWPEINETSKVQIFIIPVTGGHTIELFKTNKTQENKKERFFMNLIERGRCKNVITTTESNYNSLIKLYQSYS